MTREELQKNIEKTNLKISYINQRLKTGNDFSERRFLQRQRDRIRVLQMEQIELLVQLKSI